MADVQVLAPGAHPAPLDYLIPGAQEIILKTLFASFDGSAAAAAFYPAIQLIAPGNVLAGTFKTQSTVAAGGSADVTFGPFLEDGVASGGGIPSLSVATAFADSSGANPHAWTGIITNDAALYSIDGGDATKLRIAATGVYLIVLTRTGPAIVPGAILIWTITLFDNSGFAIQSQIPLDVEPTGGVFPQINNLSGSGMIDPQGDLDVPYYLTMSTSPAASSGSMALRVIRLSPNTEA